MKNFVDFVVDASQTNGLSDEFDAMIKSADQKSMSKWLKGKGYDVREEECKKMVDHREDIRASKLGLNY
jgi:hypothetical protein